jgi:hypothetical protein
MLDHKIVTAATLIKTIKTVATTVEIPLLFMFKKRNPIL